MRSYSVLLRLRDNAPSFDPWGYQPQTLLKSTLRHVESRLMSSSEAIDDSVGIKTHIASYWVAHDQLH